ncbi:RNA polymerase sigma factor [Xenophilus arseniciresistens]|uniref:RNA polymerase sigma factor n=1 Tax=Xenophilus arseniciresistens TaxID=1283306 RepID=A0AAE3N6C7_9BURK|nr:RNA polymerase sigma factor [Xenophilus arseniciresistens]MDA7415181.1 RNA polymerase sigma factor [Xenophilus arseniciresistens]
MTENVIPLLRSFLVQSYDQLKQRLALRLGNVELAEDALHETWLKLERSEAIAGPVAKPQAYLLRMAVNLAIDVRRAQSQVLQSDDIDALMNELPDPAPGPAEVAEARSQLEALDGLLLRLPPRRRQILLLVRVEGWSQRDVAERLGIPVRTVEYELRAAQAHLFSRWERDLTDSHDGTKK